MLTGVHFLLTYTCNFTCDHCFLYCGPEAEGTFTLRDLTLVLDQALEMQTVGEVYFEGGEPFLYYPLMLAGIKAARDRGFRVGVVTNAYFATSVEDAGLWLSPLRDLGVADLSISDDAFHFGRQEETPAARALQAAKVLGLPVDSICIQEPMVEKDGDKGEPVVGGGAMFRGRAAEKLVQGLPRKPWQSFQECPFEDLHKPKRVHVDPFGNVHLCQGLWAGNVFKAPLGEIFKNYDHETHPICRCLVKGGPALLVRENGLKLHEGYVDACHLCYEARRSLLGEFPHLLGPPLVYGK